MLKLCLSTVLLVSLPVSLFSQGPIDLGSRRELFVDEFLIARMSPGVNLHLHRPAPREVVLVTDRPWEGNTCAYYTIFQDGKRYRMYYRGSHYDEKNRRASHREVTCYAESKDGIHWDRPDLGLFGFAGSKKNNIVWDGIGTHNFTPFRDARPGCPEESRYKALAAGFGKGKSGLYAFGSPDGIHWKLLQSAPVITKGAFDSQNLAFWDRAAGLYREFHRIFRDGIRDIMTATSKDFLHWTEPVVLDFPGAPREHLYTNAIRSYERAPHLLIGFPTRFQPRNEQVEPLFMSSRDGKTFKRWPKPVIPVTAPQDRGGNRSNYLTWGLVQLPGGRDWSVYATEAYYTGPSSRLRRFTYRLDGFVSVRAPAEGGEVLTRPITFTGKKLPLNFVTAKEGNLKVEIQDAAGKALPGFALADCRDLRGDAIDQAVSWKKGGDLGSLAGTPIRLRLQLRAADLFALRFGE